MLEERWEGAGSAFAGLGLDPKLSDSLKTLGYEEPTSLQRAAIPKLLEGRDLVALASSGSGKTAAFALALAQRTASRARSRVKPTSLVVVDSPDRATRVAAAIFRVGQPLGLDVLPLHEGQSHPAEARALERGADVVVVTPSRALDHLRRGALRLDGVATVILDEADRVVEDSPEAAVDSILSAVPRPRQLAVFSASFPAPLVSLIRSQIPNAEEFRPARERPSSDHLEGIRQTAHLVAPGSRIDALGRILDADASRTSLIFCRGCKQAEEIATLLGGRGRAAAPLHSSLPREARDRLAEDLRSGLIDVLVLTDPAARNLDIDPVPLVIHCGMAPDAETYARRLSFLGHSFREARSVVIAEAREYPHLRQIERILQKPIEIEDLPHSPDLSAPGLVETWSGILHAARDGGLESYRGVLETLARELDLVEIALAAIKRTHQLEGSSQPPEEPDETPWYEPAPSPQDRYEPVPRKPDREPARPPRRARPLRHDPVLGGVARLFIGIGRQAGVQPKDLVGAIANEAGIPGNMVGAIDIAERFSLVEVPTDVADHVIEALRATKIRGKKVIVRHDQHTEA